MNSIAVNADDCWNRIGIAGDHSCPELAGHVHCRNCPVFSAAAQTLLDRDLPADHRAGWTRYFAEKRIVKETNTLSVLIFRINAEWIALPAAVLTEVADQRTIHSLPHRRNRLVGGVVNVRGELLICVLLGELLGVDGGGPLQPQSTGAVHRRLLVASREGSRFAFPADEVHGIHRFHPRELRAPPATVAQSARTYTTGVLPWGERAVGCLDDELLFYTLNRSLA